MLRRYCLYGGIHRPLTQPHPSKRFGRGPTMTLSTAPQPPNRHSPFVDDIRGWDEFFFELPSLNSFRSTLFWFCYPRSPKIPWAKTAESSVHPRNLFSLRALTLFCSFKWGNTRNITSFPHNHHKSPRNWK